jgi:hypothetical protein
MIGRIQFWSQEIPHLAVRLVLALAFLVLNHAALLIELGLADGPRQVPHPVGLHPEN